MVPISTDVNKKSFLKQHTTITKAKHVFDYLILSLRFEIISRAKIISASAKLCMILYIPNSEGNLIKFKGDYSQIIEYTIAN